jgi:alpha-amylase
MTRATLRVSLALAAAWVFLLAAAAFATGIPAWWQDAVFYEVFVRSFQDSNGDGKGDLSGLIDRLDYLNDGDPSTTDDLGVTALWLMPIMASPSYHGYDVIDYYRVESDYGSNADFQRLVEEAHERGIRVIVDLVLNHTSTQNAWYIASLNRSSPYRTWYVWSDASPGYAGPWGEQVWYPRGGAFYYAVFSSGMPDLNYRNPAVTTQMFDVARYWLVDMKADGFRLDAVRYLIENGVAQEDTPATHFWLKGFDAVAKGWSPDAYLVGEVWTEPEIIAPYLDREVDQCFEFSLAEAIVSGVRDGVPSRVASALARVLNVYPQNQFATFLSNHDQERVMSRLFGSIPRAKLAASILLTLPGTPFLYYGEEVGMSGTKPDERIRTPMQWTPSVGGGFTTGAPWEALQPDAENHTVAGQTADPESLLSRYRDLIRLRLAHEALRHGSTTLVDVGTAPALGYVRATAEETLLVLHSFSAVPQTPTVRVPSLAPGRYRAIDALAGGKHADFSIDSNGTANGLPLVLEPLGTLVLTISRP